RRARTGEHDPCALRAVRARLHARARPPELARTRPGGTADGRAQQHRGAPGGARKPPDRPLAAADGPCGSCSGRFTVSVAVGSPAVSLTSARLKNSVLTLF